MELAKQTIFPTEPTQDATEEYPQSGRTLQVFCLRKTPMGGKGGQADDRSADHAEGHSRPICSGCGRKGPGYDRLPPRRFEFVPLWQIAVFFVYAMRRVDCPRCGVTVEQVPWAEGKCTLTTTFRWFLARWAKRLSLAGSGRGLLGQLGGCVSLGKTRGFVGAGASRSERDRGYRRGRDPVAPRASLPDIGLPNPGRHEALVVDCRGSDGARACEASSRRSRRRCAWRFVLFAAICGSLT